ncbi:hypothetical protein Bb109J_c2012 [Bdellovibrio bacteriovorus]|uniref:Uncharacterized protein n=2 Tax=Bdellovibrio bacteriovorus TaxID=959 RepID=Q6ML58_BDEBA|nr:hypothetical protein EP01_07100 [Bdellovibrio bacteriovorus]BEV68592.1 hypothetical protein Bb109J_c2012 [Bdellovibrio bacteriovorus]CAE79999.1 hypothetical protein predicted by Glimmer/Critica [Bdellovibrio bacteriovorus HD100]
MDMATIWKFTKFVIGLVVLVLILWAVLANYSVIFSKTVIGEITSVERVEIPVALVTRAEGNITSQVFSFAIGIKDTKTNEIFTASSEDRQWAVAQPGQCAEAVFLPYPPWQFTKKDTYFGARLVKLHECAK